MFNFLIKLPRTIKKSILVVHDIVLLFCAFWLAVGVRLPITQEWYNQNNWEIWGLTTIISLCGFAILGLYRTVLRFVGRKTLLIIFVGSLFSVLSMIGVVFYLELSLPRTVTVTYFLFVIVLLSGSRFTTSGLLQSHRYRKAVSHPVIIYGAGESGRQLVESLKQMDTYYPVAFVDDNECLQNTVIYSKKVYNPNRLASLIKRYHVDTILLAMPSASKKERRIILQKLEHLNCKVLSIPGMKDLVEDKVSIGNLKKVSVSDLLGRDAVDPDQNLMEKDIKDKVVMVTGAGGSIGSELCRQIIKNAPTTLILFELSEFSLYVIEKELSEKIRKRGLNIQLIPALGSVQNQARVSKIMQTYNVQTLYHAAAYKHVPMVEFNTIEGVQNNIFGTLHCAQAAVESKVETFVLISTDKAVRPTNTMGTTKRMAELVLQALAQENTGTRFCMVRFGNVLGSSGSVIPLFEKQIAEGGPITLTHPEITRFFMTIPEAAQLVIQAGAMGKGGDVFLLDMGESVKIIDLARQMVRLSGLEIKDENTPEGDIEIKITGLRPGEKLYEELLIGNNAQGSSHPKIMTTTEQYLDWRELNKILKSLDIACENFNVQEVRTILVNAPADFHPADPVCDVLLKG